MKDLIFTSQELVKKVSMIPLKKRSLYAQIDFSQKMIGLVGQRGVGKTTLLLQFLSEKKDRATYIYFSADDIYFLENNLKKTVETLYRDYGIRVFCIDEVHKYKNWNQELKNIYDALPEVQIIFSGSSSVDLIHGSYDLSRRAILYHLPGLSFREYIFFKTKKEYPIMDLEHLLQNYKKYSLQISTEIEIEKLFRSYLEHGYYPYFLEGTGLAFERKLENVINKTIYEDIANLKNIKTHNLPVFKKILNFLVSIPPGQINVNKLAKTLGPAFETIEDYIDLLHRISLIRYLLKDKTGYKLIRQAEKLFLDNTNIAYFLQKKLGLEETKGTTRELFFLNQVQNSGYDVFMPEKGGDFRVRLGQKEIVFEVGGKNKGFDQIAGNDNSFLVLDDITIAENHQIPLYLFGFLY